ANVGYTKEKWCRVILKEEYSKSVVEVKKVSDRVMNVKLEVEGMMINVTSAYAPQVGCKMEEKEKFWSELDEVVDGVPRNERLVIGADFKCQAGEWNRGDEEVMGRYGLKQRNVEGQMVVDFAKRMEMAVVNTYFKKKEDHRMTYKSGGRCTQVDNVLCRRCNLKEIGDCKVLAGESGARQHRMVVCRMVLEVKKKSRTDRRIRWWKLKEEEDRQGLGGGKEVLDDWETTAGVMREAARKVLEKAYDRVPREELWYCIRKSGVSEKYVRVVQDMYEDSVTAVKCAVGTTDWFKVKVGLHQGSALSPFLFAVVMDRLTDKFRQESPWTMMFVDDIVICGESSEQVEKSLERWRYMLERRGMKVSRSKTEYMCVNEREGSGGVRWQGEEVEKVEEFRTTSMIRTSLGSKRHIPQRRPFWLFLRNCMLLDTTASARISACLSDISSCMSAHQLKLNPSKTELLVILGSSTAILTMNIVSKQLYTDNVVIKSEYVLYKVEYKVLLFVFKAINGLAPAYLAELVTVYKPARTPHSSGHTSLVTPKYKYKKWRPVICHPGTKAVEQTSSTHTKYYCAECL
ncbi:hypothetical protein HF521_017235, partial [Silurus meridionalis]